MGYMFDNGAFYTKWLQDIRDAQHTNGTIDDVAPTYWPDHTENVAWPSAAIIITNTLFEQNGDKEAVRQNYDCLKKRMTHLCRYLDNGIIDRDYRGDWCVPPEDMTLIHSADPARITGKAVITTPFFYNDARLMQRFAHLLDNSGDVQFFGELGEMIKHAFNKKFFDKKQGHYDNGTQTSYILPLAYGMVPEDQHSRVFDNLVTNIEIKSNNHVGCGIIGVKYLYRVLSDNGRPDLAYRIAVKTDYPGYGYMISKNATTIWELWNGDTADAYMNSGNHVMLLGDLIVRLDGYLTGIMPDARQPGFRQYYEIYFRLTLIGKEFTFELIRII